ncbi:M24 family metallopeptidase [Solicola gregarius]|uniref:M24 family metallopeptidase n=1 Tax=Solicola gregarius TaxID=2908642 RepID=A0AA46TFT8_9ACTN|nr:M24 family metallopeptidase [Solicola gregarius]UYM03788.1 M24 family metallopeptidase [Solicola gregarius]
MTRSPEMASMASDAEYAERLRRVRASMERRSLSALVVTDPANLFYLTGYNAWSFYTPQCLVLPADGPPTLFARAMDAAGARHTCNLLDEHIVGYPETLVHRPDIHPFGWITETARARGVLPAGPDAVIGAECDSHFFSARAYVSLVEGLDGARVVDSGELVNWVRLVKSEHEIAQLRIAGQIAEATMQAALESVWPGRRQCDVAGDIVAAQARGTAEHGGDYPAIPPMLPTGAAAGTPHLTWSEQPFVSGEATTIELAGAFGRYHAPLARTIHLGDPPPLLTDTANAVDEALAAGCEAIKPGVVVADVHASVNDILNRQGLVKESRIGYSIGIGYPPDWGERTVSLRAGDPTVLEAGMAFHVILGIWMDGWGYELSEPIVVSGDGVEHLTDLPHELTVRK